MAVAVAEKMIIRVYTYNNELYLEGYTLQALGAGSRVKGDLAQLYSITEKDLDGIIERSESRDAIIYDKQYKPLSREYLNKNAYLEKSNKFRDSIGSVEKTSSPKQQKTSSREEYLYMGKTRRGDPYIVYLAPFSMTLDKLTNSMKSREYTVTETGAVYHYREYEGQLYPEEFKRFWNKAMEQGAARTNFSFEDLNTRKL